MKSLKKKGVSVSIEEEVELDEKFDVKTAATKKGKISVSSFDSLEDAEKHLAGMEKKGHKGIISKNGKPVFRGTSAEIKKQMKAYKKKHDKIGIGEDRQLKDPKKEVMVVKRGKVIVIDKKDQKKYMSKGWELAEEIELKEKPADFIRLSFNSPADVKKAKKWMDQKLLPPHTLWA